MHSACRLALFVILASCPAANADTIFNLSATINAVPAQGEGYPPSSQATGTLTIDTVLGAVTGSTVQTSLTAFDYVLYTEVLNSSYLVIVLANNPTPVFPFPPNGEDSFDIVLPVTSLVGYTGGLGCSATYEPAPICATPTADFASEIIIDGEAAATVQTLSLTPAVTQIPEPNSLVLLGTGLLGLAAPILYRRRPSAKSSCCLF